MGAFFGTIHLWNADAAATKKLVAAVARSTKQKFLVAPPRDGWTTVFPDGHGQNERVADAVAARYAGHVLYVRLHDDDVFGYRYYHAGRLIDEYNSGPDYFGEVSPDEAARVKGRPELLAPVLSDAADVEPLRRILHDARGAGDAFTGIQAFARLLNLPNALTAYEYLTQGETDDVPDVARFVHVPSQREQQNQRRAADAAAAAKQRLRAGGLLLLEVVGPTEMSLPVMCADAEGGGYFLAWSQHGGQRVAPARVQHLAPPFSGAAARELPVDAGPTLYSMAASRSGRFLATGHAAGEWVAKVWDLASGQLVCAAQNTRAVGWVGFSADETKLYSFSEELVITSVPDGRELARSPHLRGAGHSQGAALHPRGDVIVMSRQHLIALLDARTGQLIRCYPVGGGATLPSPHEPARRTTLAVEPDERLLRKTAEQVLKRMQAMGLGTARSVDELLESMRQMQEQSRQQQAVNDASPVPFGMRGTETVFDITFTADGRRLILATDRGLRVYDWEAVTRSRSLLPAPSLAVDGASRAIQSDAGAAVWAFSGSYTYTCQHDATRDVAVFAGLAGRVETARLSAGAARAGVDVPGRMAVNRILLSHDRTSLAMTLRQDLSNAGRGSRPKPGIVQVWDWRAFEAVATPSDD